MDNRIWIADTNLLAFPSPRRFITGCAAFLQADVCMTPTLADELRYKIADILLHPYTRRPEIANAILADPELERRRTRLFIECRNAVEDLWTRRIGPMIGSSDTAQADEMFTQLGARQAFSRSTNQNDARIVVEGVCGGCDMVLSNSFRTIDHEALNSWWRTMFGRNDDLLLLAPKWFARAGIEPADGLLVAAATCASREHRPAADDARCTRTLLGKLRRSFGAAAERMLDELDAIEADGGQEALVRAAQEASETPRFRHARAAEDILHKEVLSDERRAALEHLRQDALSRTAPRRGLGHARLETFEQDQP